MTTKNLSLEQERNRKRWLDALRSGKYRQGREYLNRGGNYCCLGVAAKAVFDADWVTVPAVRALGAAGGPCKGLPDPQAFTEEVDTEWVDTVSLPLPMLQALGLSEAAQDDLMQANDTDRLSFREIANMIESGKV